MAKILKNTTGATIGISSLGFDIPASSQVTVPTQDYGILASSDVISELTSNINSGNIVINDGTKDLSPTVGLDHISTADHFSEENIIFAKQDELWFGNDPRPVEDNLLVYTYNSGTATYTDVSADAKSISGSTFQCPGTGTDNAIYVSVDLQENGDYVKIKGLEYSCTQAIASGYLNVEYWGGGWYTAPVMVTETSGDYLTKRNDHFYDTGIYNLRLEKYSTDFWQKNDPISSGTNRYWLRFRVNNALGAVPIFEYFLPRTDCGKINKSGFIEYFGDTRPTRLIPITTGGAVSAYSSPSEDPANKNLYIGKKFGVGRELNKFDNGLTSRQTFIAFLPPDLDTSMPVHLKAYTTANVATSGNVKYTVYYTYSNQGDSIYDAYSAAPTSTSPEYTETITKTYASADTIIEIDAELDLESFQPRSADHRSDSTQLLWISIERNGSDAADTYTGDTVMLEMSLLYTAWSHGGAL